jgi:hypothetical protein
VRLGLSSASGRFAGQLYPDTVYNVMVYIQVLDHSGTAVYADSLQTVFYNGEAVYRLDSLHVAGDYRLVVSARGAVPGGAVAAAGRIYSTADTSTFRIIPGAAWRGDIAQVVGTQYWYLDTVTVQVTGTDPVSAYFQLHIFDRWGNRLQDVGGVPVAYGAPAGWYDNGVRTDSGLTHGFTVTLSTLNRVIGIRGRAVLPGGADTVFVDSLWLLPLVPASLVSVSFYDTNGNGKIDRLMFRFSNTVNPYWDGMVFSRTAGYDTVELGEVRPYDAGAAEDTVWIVSLRESSRMPYRTDSIPAVLTLLGSNDSNLVTASTEYVDKAGPAIVSFRYVPSHCESNDGRNRILIGFSERMMVYRDGSLVNGDLGSGDVGSLVAVYDSAGDLVTDRCGSQAAALSAEYISEVHWQAPETTATIDLIAEDQRCNALQVYRNWLAFHFAAGYYAADTFGNQPALRADSTGLGRTVLTREASSTDEAACPVKQKNYGTAGEALIIRGPDGSILGITGDYHALAYVDAPGLRMDVLLSALDGSGPATDYTHDTTGLRSALLRQSLGIFADVQVFDLLGNLTWHVTHKVYPTDFAPGATLQEQTDNFMNLRMYEQAEVDYKWESLNDAAKGKLLAWDFRNDRGRPVAKGAYVVRVFFRNSLIAKENTSGRYEAFNGPVMHR